MAALFWLLLIATFVTAGATYRYGVTHPPKKEVAYVQPQTASTVQLAPPDPHADLKTPGWVWLAIPGAALIILGVYTHERRRPVRE